MKDHFEQIIEMKGRIAAARAGTQTPEEVRDITYDTVRLALDNMGLFMGEVSRVILNMHERIQELEARDAGETRH